MEIKIRKALISVFDKTGLDEIVETLAELNVQIYSTGGTQTWIESKGISVYKVEDLTGYPSILGGRVKTLHPKVFGGILSTNSIQHQEELSEFNIPTFDLVMVDLYPFEQTWASTNEEGEIIEKIDIGGISLIRAAAKNFSQVIVIPSKNHYQYLQTILTLQKGKSTLEQRRYLAGEAFKISSAYDHVISMYLTNEEQKNDDFRRFVSLKQVLRYGENPHQTGIFYGAMDSLFTKLSGKDLSYNNLLDVDAALSLMSEFKGELPTFAIFKHNNTCGIAQRPTLMEAYKAALAADPVSAFGGILISNHRIDLSVAELIHHLFYEVLIAPGYSDAALELLHAKGKRILLDLHNYPQEQTIYRSLLSGVIVQDKDNHVLSEADLTYVTVKKPLDHQVKDLLFAMACVKHLKSNAIVIVKNLQMIGMGCGQTSRVDACIAAIEKAKHFGFELDGAVMASDAFFPFPDCVELAGKEGIDAIIQPGGSVKDHLSIEYCDLHQIAMVFTGVRHFKH